MTERKQGLWAKIRYIAASDRISGLIMLGFALAGLLLANLPFTAHAFEELENFRIAIPYTNIDMGLGHWVQDGLLTVFFLTVGLELKQELTTGSLSNPKAAAVPMLCAVGGMLAPPVLFIGVISLFAAAGSGATRHRFRKRRSPSHRCPMAGGAHSHGYRVLIGRIGPVRQSVAGIHPRFSDDIGHSGRPAGHHPDRGVLLIGERMVLVPWHSRMRGRLVLPGPHAQGTVVGRGHRGACWHGS